MVTSPPTSQNWGKEKKKKKTLLMPGFLFNIKSSRFFRQKRIFIQIFTF
jgi:hypothetical protein